MSFTKIDNNNIAPTGVTAGSYTNANITVNESGQITSASNGVAGTGGGGGGGTGLQHTTYTYTPDGSTTTFAATSGITVHTVLVILDGVTQMPTTDYTVSGSNVVFTSAPPASSVLQIRVLGDVASSGGPKISNIAITDSNWDAIDDTAVDITGGYIKITGTGFVSGCLAYFNQTAAASISFVSSTELRISTGSLAASTYVLYVINPDGGVAISVPGVTFSATPAWQTASSLSDQYDGVAITLSLVATEATSYTLVSGSLPPSLSLNTSTGAITGTVVGVTVDTTYTFTVRATDAQLQDSPRTFTVTITVSDPYFNSTALLLSGSALTTNTVLRDSSTNNFNLTVSGDARASNFSPYGTGWSVYFDGTGDSLSITNTTALQFGTGDFTVEAWVYLTATPGAQYAQIIGRTEYGSNADWMLQITNTRTLTWYMQGSFVATSTGTILLNTWTQVAATRSGSSIRLFINGTIDGTATNSGSTENTSSGDYTIGADQAADEVNLTGYISNLRVIKGTALYTANFTPATTNLTAVANTSLLTCNANRFMDGSTNNFAVTRNGDAKVTGFNPFNITNTGVNGSMYFDGTTDSVRLPSNAISALPGDFTLEFWIYLISTAGNPVIYLVNATAALIIYVVSSKVVVRSYGTADLLTSVDNIQINTWTHVAVARSSSALSLWLNGSRASGGTITYSTAFPQGEIRIATNELDLQSTNGYIADLRLIKGTAQYNPSNTTITVPTAPLTAVTNTQLLTLQYDQPHNNHTFLDSSSNQFLITRSGNATQGTFSPFSPGGWSGYFNGSTDGIVIASGSDSYDFNSWMLESTASKTGTIEAWIYLQSYSTPTAGTGVYTHRCIFGRGSTFLNFGVRPDGKLRLYYYNTSSNQNWFESAANAIQLNTWYHVAFVADAGIGKLYINGVYSSGNRINGGTDSGTTAFNGVAVGTFSEGGIHYIGRENAETTTSRWHGYIANLRIVSGQSLYTTNFTPSTSPLTTTSQGVSGTNCKLLTLHTNRFKDDGPNNRIFTLEGTTRIQAFSPFATTAVYNPVTHGGSGYVDGSGDYFILTNESAYDFGDGNFSIDFWYYPLSAQGYGGIYMRDGQDYPLGIYSGTSITPAWPECSMAVGTTTTWFATGINTSGVQKYAWNHIAFTRVGNIFRAFTNGVLSTVVTASGTMGSGGTPWIGKNGTAAGLSELSMYLSGFRMTKGGIPTLFSTSSTTTGTTIFAVPTQPFTANASLTGGSLSILANFADAAILDSTGRTVIETVADAKSTSVVSKFAGGSMSFDGTGDRLATVFSPLQDLSIGNWTIEFWLNLGATIPTTYRSICGASNGGGNLPKWAMIMNANTGYTYQANRLMFATYNGADRQINVAVTWASNTWYHIAVVHNNGITALYLDGSSQGTIAFNIASGITGAIRIGADGEGYSDFTGYISDFRITRGYARYTSNFTPPTAPHRLK